MGRPKLRVGTHGSIRAYGSAASWTARTLFRDSDGQTREVKRGGTSKSNATQNLQAALRDRQRAATGDLSRESTFAEAGVLWLAEVRRRQTGTTYDRYYTRLHGRLIPDLGKLTLGECTTGVLDRYIKRISEELRYETVRGYRTVLSGTFGFAVRMDALQRNPVRDIADIRGERRSPRALTRDEREDLLAKLDDDTRAVEDDLPSVIRYLLGTGVRIGEAMALRWFRVDLDEGVVVHGDNLVRERGAGLVLHSPKTEAGFRVLPLPDFVLDMLRFRYPGEGFDHNPVFANAVGGWRDPSNTQRSVALFRKSAGYPWFTTHVCRRTAITVCDQAGLTAREISGYHGHARPSFTQDRYMDRRQQSGAVSRALDAGMRPIRT